MDAPPAEHARACSWVIASARESQQAPYQLTFLSVFPEPASIEDNAFCEKPRKHDSAREAGNSARKDNDPAWEDHAAKKRTRRATCRSITASDVAPFDSAASCRPLLRTPMGESLPALYARTPINPCGADLAHPGETFLPADPDTIIESAAALLAHRLRRGVKILRDPHLLLRFLQIRLVAQPQPVFAMFFLDRRQRLIRFAEIFRGQHDQVTVHPKEVVRETIECNAELVLCVRSDPAGYHDPTPQDIEDAKRVKRAMNLLSVELMDYVVVGTSVTSLRARGVI